MKTKLTLTIKIILINLLFVLSVISSKGQTTFTSENFDGVVMPALPSGWTTTYNFNIGWRTDSTNISTGYTNASGLNNAVIRNSDSSGYYTLYSPLIVTTNYSNITVMFATRVSSNFTSSGSSIPAFEYTVDGGGTWSNIPYLDNQANSTWDWVNGGIRIVLGANANNQAAVQFRWTVNIVTDPQGTYRIDDFNVEGNNTSGINEVIFGNKFNIFPNPVSDKFIINNKSQLNSSEYTMEISDLNGQILNKISNNIFHSQISCQGLSNGVYVISITDAERNVYRHKLVIAK